MPLLDRIFGRARRAEERDQARRKNGADRRRAAHPYHVQTDGVVREVVEIQLEGAVAVDADDVVHGAHQC